MEEALTYDDMDRLTGVRLGTAPTGAMVYDGYGRMTSKTAGGNPVFSDAVFGAASKPHALDRAFTPSGTFPSTPQTVSYTGFDKVLMVKQGNDSLCYTYGYDRQRIAMEEHVGNIIRTKRYVGNCEFVSESSGNVTTQKWLTYLIGPTGVYAVMETSGSTNTLHYVLKDNLGSWTTITDSDGTVEQRLSYDAWGNLRNPETLGGSNLFKNFYVGPSFKFLDFFHFTAGVNVCEYEMLTGSLQEGDILPPGFSLTDQISKVWKPKPFLSLSFDLDFISYIKK